MKYNFTEIEAKWQEYWAKNETFKAVNPKSSNEKGRLKPKFYVLDMFPYPSGAGLHVGHPLGYIASDIYARYKRHKGFNVLHPMGYDSFGLPAEQYAIQTGQHPADTTKVNIEGGVDKEGNHIEGYRKQLDRMGFSFDWSREVRTSDPKYYKWTQWIFIQLFNSWYNKDADKAEPIDTLISRFETEGNEAVNAVCDDDTPQFTKADWNSYSDTEKQQLLLKYRLTYLADTEVNWCPALGTVLANDEIVNGVSERGGHPVIRKKMTQWSMRITAYAQRLLDGLEKIDWPQPLKDLQTNWIGRSEGASVTFPVLSLDSSKRQKRRDGYETKESKNADLPLAPSQGGGTDVGQAKDSAAPKYYTSDSEIYGTLLERAKEMRENPTKAEDLLWKALKNRSLAYKFRRQHPIFEYIVDFVCLEKQLIIEVDGEIHQYQLSKDQERQLQLEQKKGYSVLRFTNDEVLNDIENVLSQIDIKLREIPLKDTNWGNRDHESNSPSLGGGRGEVLSGTMGIDVFTTRPDTIFGVSFMTLAPEHELVAQITTPAQKAEVDAYVEATAKRSERDRMADVKTITGAFTGSYAEHPFTKEPIPIWIGDYVLAGYGTGAVMSVPCGDQRDYDFAQHFGIPIPNIFEGIDISEEAFSDKETTIIANSDFLNGLSYKEATRKAIAELEKIGLGEGKVNYRLRDAVFSRQRYWGEPFPVYYVNGLPQMIDEEHLPIELPEVEKYLPTETGEPPLGNATEWAWDIKQSAVVSNQLIDHKTVFPLELNTMPGWAGSSQYFNRYMDPHNEEAIYSQQAINYWQDVDLYIGGSEHATGHLLYSRFWQKFLFDKGLVPKDEFAKKLINQGMITGESAFVQRIGFNISFSGPSNFGKIDTTSGYGTLAYLSEKESLKQLQEKYAFVQNYFLSDEVISHFKKRNDKNKESIAIREKLTTFFLKDLQNEIESLGLSDKVNPEFTPLINKYNFYKTRVPVAFVNLKNELDINKFKTWLEEYKTAELIGDRDDVFVVSREVEKMSKSKYNVVNPDAICAEYGADSLRMYEMFLGPLEQSKPWNTAGITGVHSFLKKLWKLYHSDAENSFKVSDEEAKADALKTLHKTIKKVEDDIENFSFNTSVSTFMICVNELTAQKCTSRAILEPLTILVSPYAPHIAEELWEKLGHSGSIAKIPFPKFEQKYLIESSKEYPISFNGKMRFTLELPLDISKDEIEAQVMAHEKTQAQLQGRMPKKVIVVPGKIVNIVG